MRKNNIKISLIVGIAFFVVGLITLPHYGINWDTINHLPRGQVYLRYFLTGKKDYSDLPKFVQYWQKPESLGIDSNLSKDQISTRSFYQLNSVDLKEYLENDGGGHPPLSDILSSVFNRVFFGKLRLVNDIDSYRIYSIFLASCLVGLIFWWVANNYGLVAGVVSSLSLALYPLFWSESHFNNEKDIPETVFWSFMIFCFWKGFTTKKRWWILISGIFFGLALGTKFNVLFVPFVLAPWLLFYWFGKYSKRFSFSLLIRDNFRLIIAVFIAILLGFFIFMGSWPYLWPDPITRLVSVFGFYKEIGVTQNVNLNTYALQWIITTSPPIILFLSFIGIIYSLVKTLKEKNKMSLLFLLWLIVPIARVTWPGTTIYGGIRQIMEFIPAMAVLAGIGAFWILKAFKKKKFIYIFVISIIAVNYLFSAIRLYKIHPNENVYFNFFVGGLDGAREKDIPFWGNSFGAAYREGVVWLNAHAEKNAKVVLVHELMPNIPSIWFRPDIDFHNSGRSGPAKKGEYAITLTYQGNRGQTYYDSYLETTINPVYEIKVDGVPIAKIWKNDIEHTKENFVNERRLYDFSIIKTQSGFRVDLNGVYKVSKLKASFNTLNCEELTYAYSQISEDGSNWSRLPGTMPGEDWNTTAFGSQPSGSSFIQPFAAEKTRYIDYIVFPQNACIKDINNLEIYIFQTQQETRI